LQARTGIPGAHAAIAAAARPPGRASSDDSRAEAKPTATTPAQTVTCNPYIQPTHTVLRGPVEPGQYTALVFGQTCREAGIELSTGRKGRAHDNAVRESLFATLKKGLVNRRSWPRRQQLRTAVFDYIEAFYNPVRLHSTLGYLSPADYQRRHANGLVMPASGGMLTQAA
jgi:hypothetical protein